jgi:hypothetical protein
MLAVEGLASLKAGGELQMALQSLESVSSAFVDPYSHTVVVELQIPNEPDVVDELLRIVRRSGLQGVEIKGLARDDPIGWQEHLETRVREWRRRFAIAVMFGAPVIPLELLGPGLEGLAPGGHVWRGSIELFLTGWAIYSAGAVFLVGVILSIIARKTNADLPIGLALAGLFVASAWQVFSPVPLDFDLAAWVLIVSCLRRWIDAVLRLRGRRSLIDVSERDPELASEIYCRFRDEFRSKMTSSPVDWILPVALVLSSLSLIYRLAIDSAALHDALLPAVATILAASPAIFFESQSAAAISEVAGGAQRSRSQVLPWLYHLIVLPTASCGMIAPELACILPMGLSIAARVLAIRPAKESG